MREEGAEADALLVGTEVRVFSRSRHQPAPEGGWVGTITSVGRRYATAEYEAQGTAPGTAGASRRTIEFEIQTGNGRQDRTQSGPCVRTLRQLESDHRRAEAIAVLTAHGVEFRRDSAQRLTTEQIEQLAAVVRAWDREG